MKFVPTAIPDVICVELDVHSDERGSFVELFHAEKYAAGGITTTFVQDNQSISKKGTLRGLHAQRVHAQGKLVRALQGTVYDVAVDVRLGSPTFGRWVGVELTDKKPQQLYVPVGFVHGFCVLSETAHVEYKCTDFYHPEDEFGVRWDDPSIGIEWPLAKPTLSDKDSQLPTLKEIEHLLPRYRTG